MTDQKERRQALPRDGSTGLYTPRSARLEPPAPLLEALRHIARTTARRIYNDPRLEAHIQRCVLHWLLGWDPAGRQGIRQRIGLLAANEARRYAAGSDSKRSEILGRSNDLPRLTRREHGTERSSTSLRSSERRPTDERSSERSDVSERSSKKEAISER